MMTIQEIKDMGFKVSLKYFGHLPSEASDYCDYGCDHEFTNDESVWYEATSGYIFCSADCLEKWIKDTIDR